MKIPAIIITICLITQFTFSQDYLWMGNEYQTLEKVNTIEPPQGFTRLETTAGSFSEWLRGLPLKPTGTPVRYHDGSEKYNQSAHFRVLEIDVGEQDLQQCADAVIRLRAEYLYSTDRKDQIHFNFVSGHNVKYLDWINGRQPIIYGDKLQFVRWSDRPVIPDTYHEFRWKYLEKIYMFAGTESLQHELKPVAKPSDINIGDVFIEGSGHAVIVLDLAINDSNEKVFIIAQSYMPAQDTHILLNPDDADLSPWYRAQDNGTGTITTPEWSFSWTMLKRF